MFEDWAKPNVMALFGVAVVTAAVPLLFPEWRPAVKSAIKFGLTLVAESGEEAEAELIQSLVEATIEAICEELAKPTAEPERCAAVQQHIRHFKHRARRRSRRWDGDPEGQGRVYRRHVAKLETTLMQHAQKTSPRGRAIIADAAATLAQV